jgi:hypothetical protein
LPSFTGSAGVLRLKSFGWKWFRKPLVLTTEFLKVGISHMTRFLKLLESGLAYTSGFLKPLDCAACGLINSIVMALGASRITGIISNIFQRSDYTVILLKSQELWSEEINIKRHMQSYRKYWFNLQP